MERSVIRVRCSRGSLSTQFRPWRDLLLHGDAGRSRGVHARRSREHIALGIPDDPCRTTVHDRCNRHPARPSARHYDNCRMQTRTSPDGGVGSRACSHTNSRHRAHRSAATIVASSRYGSDGSGSTSFATTRTTNAARTTSISTRSSMASSGRRLTGRIRRCIATSARVCFLPIGEAPAISPAISGSARVSPDCAFSCSPDGAK